MASFDELVNKYVARLVTADRSEIEFEKILSEIDNLVYSVSNIGISVEDKADIVQRLIKKLEILFPDRPKRIFEQEEIIKAFSNDEYLELIKYIKARTKK